MDDQTAHLRQVIEVYVQQLATVTHQLVDAQVTNSRLEMLLAQAQTAQDSGDEPS